MTTTPASGNQPCTPEKGGHRPGACMGCQSRRGGGMACPHVGQSGSTFPQSESILPLFIVAIPLTCAISAERVAHKAVGPHEEG